MIAESRNSEKYEISLEILSKCNICPRNCNANRFSGKLGYCKSDAGFNISSICLHKGEEPVISGDKGICNIFFSHCNMQCSFCQNFEISENTSPLISKYPTIESIIERIMRHIEGGAHAVGFVSPSHHVPHVKVIIQSLQRLGIKPVFVYNTNAYDKVETLKELEGLIDIYLPDFKYFDNATAKKYSNTTNYYEYATNAIREMYRQKGSVLSVNEKNEAESGLIIRHLVLPGHINESIALLRFIAEEISLNVHISLMSQYFPTTKMVKTGTLDRTLAREEYERVVDAMQSFGLFKGWIQELESNETYRPDFSKDQVFE